jgi:hypothetical protein
MTRLVERLGILSPLCLVEIGGKKMAGVVDPQWIDADRPLTGKPEFDS